MNDSVDAFAMGSYLSAAEAKRDYFLTAADLKALSSRPLGIWGAGNTKLYSPRDVADFAVAKHGIDGLRKKRESRIKREDKKRKREEEAQALTERLGLGTPSTPAIAGGDASVRGLVLEARRALQQFCSWDYLRSKSAPHGTSATVRREPRNSEVVISLLLSCRRASSESNKLNMLLSLDGRQILISTASLRCDKFSILRVPPIIIKRNSFSSVAWRMVLCACTISNRLW